MADGGRRPAVHRTLPPGPRSHNRASTPRLPSNALSEVSAAKSRTKRDTPPRAFSGNPGDRRARYIGSHACKGSSLATQIEDAWKWMQARQ
jgi:hypothetical protein